ncbi:MAG: DUF6036 family nucleotidyltransferase [Kineosporiaceae bacterium]
MKRADLEHILRAASRIADERDVLVIGSQAIVASVEDEALPAVATASIEADVAFFDDPDDEKADLVDGAIGELSPFHEMYGYYAQGVSVRTAVLPEGWRDRLVVLDTPATQPGRGVALEPHDLVLAKLVAGREKDHAFALALIRAGVVDAVVLHDRAAVLPVSPALISQMRSWIRSAAG